MNKIILSLISLATIAATTVSCTKKQSTPVVPAADTVYLDTNNTSAANFTISGIIDIPATTWDTISIPLTLKRITGTGEKITLTIDGVPDKTEARFSSSSGYTDFTTNLRIKSKFTRSGKYPLNISATTEKGEIYVYKVALVVDTLTTKEANTLFKNSTVAALKTTPPGIDSVVDETAFITFDNANQELYLSKLLLHRETFQIKSYRSNDTYNYDVKLLFNSQDGTLTVPMQNIEGLAFSGGGRKPFTISGTGKMNLDDNTFEITYTSSFNDAGTTVTDTYRVVGYIQ